MNLSIFKTWNSNDLFFVGVYYSYSICLTNIRQKLENGKLISLMSDCR